MSFQEKESITKIRDEICGDIDVLLDDIHPGRTETSTNGVTTISHAIARAEGGQLLLLDRKMYPNVDNELTQHYRVALGGLEEECRRRNALVHTCILVLESGALPHLELERVLYPHRKLFKKYNFVKPLVSHSELVRWGGLIASSELLDEESAETVKISLDESNLHTFNERVRMGGIKDKIRTIRRGY